MEKLKGKYIIKLEVDWLYEEFLNKGNLVVYGSENNIKIERLPKSKHPSYHRLRNDVQRCLS